MKIVKKKKWFKIKENKKSFHNLKITKNVNLYLIKICLCIGLVIAYFKTNMLLKEKIFILKNLLSIIRI